MNRSRLFKSVFALLSFVLLTAGKPGPSVPVSLPVTPYKVHIEPSPDYSEMVKEIDAAKSRVHLSNFHLTHQDVVQALIRAAARPGVDVQVILDKAIAARDRNPNVIEQLKAARVPVKEGSTGFSISHAKVLLVDDIAMISTINLVRHSDTTRGVALFFNDMRVVKALAEILALDWKNADTNGTESPAVIPDFMVVSPVDSRKKLIDFIGSAKTHLQIEVENFLDKEIIAAVEKAHSSGVKVEIVVPRCNFSNRDMNMPAVQQLSSKGIAVRMMPGPTAAATPYIHAKFMIADESRMYVGSINFSKNSMNLAREIGILAEVGALTSQVQAAFNDDFSRSMDYNAATTASCPATPFEPVQQVPEIH